MEKIHFFQILFLVSIFRKKYSENNLEVGFKVRLATHRQAICYAPVKILPYLCFMDEDKKNNWGLF